MKIKLCFLFIIMTILGFTKNNCQFFNVRDFFRPSISSKEDANFGDAILCLYGDKLYSVDMLINTDEYLNANEEEKKILLEKQFLENKALAFLSMDSLKNLSSKFGTLIFWFFVILIIKSRFNNISNLSFLLPFLMPDSQRLLGDLINEVPKILNVFYEYYFSKAKTQTSLEKIELDYIKNKPWLSKDIQNIIEKILLKFRCAYTYESSEKSIKIINMLIHELPKDVKDIKYDLKELDAILTGFSTNTKEKLKIFCAKHTLKTYSNLSKTTIYFFGPPGTGKTYSAKLLAEYMGLEFEIITLTNFEDLVGTSPDVSDNKPGRLLEALTKGGRKKSKNMIILFDDADRVLNNKKDVSLLTFMLNLLEGETKTFYSPYLGVEIDISHLGIILAGNSEIEDPALKSRLDIITFDPYDNDTKKRIIWKNTLDTILSELNREDLKFPLNLEDLTEETDHKNINQLIDMDNEPGFRKIKFEIEKYLVCKVAEKHFDDQTCVNHLMSIKNETKIAA